MKVSECMTRDVEVATPEMSLRDAADLMGQIDAGALPVRQNERLVGMITDRDIAIRAVAAGLGPETLVNEVMSREIKYCYEDEDVDHVVRNMGDIQVRRLPVVSRSKQLVGIVALADLACHAEDRANLGMALSDISRDSGLHSQISGGNWAH
ncbi:MAG TPA: CBS domain-containing protein [Solimonas sp.]|nr:CBS domain-containing protein [Solimonas sp.]